MADPSARETAARIFFRNFPAALLVAASAALWMVPLWIVATVFSLSPPWWMHVLGVALIYGLNTRIVSGRWHAAAPVLRVYTAVALTCIFCAAFLLLCSIAATGLRLGVALMSHLTPGAAAQLGGGLGTAYRWIAPAGVGLIASLFVFGYTLGQRQLRIVRVPLEIPGLRRRLRVVQISDVHVGQNLSPQQLKRFVEKVNDQKPDLVCITGDIVDNPRVSLQRPFALLAQLRAAHGVYAILGNHDHYAGADRVTSALAAAGIRLLRDEGLTIEIDGQKLHLLGLDDRGRDWARGLLVDPLLPTLAGEAPQGVPLVLLSHRPDIFAHAVDCGVDLMLSGHTHGGQLALPWWGGRRRNLAEFMTPYSRGLFRHGRGALYVNCGLGVTGQRIRLFTPREVSVFDLTPAAPVAVPQRVSEASDRFARMSAEIA